MQGSKVRACLQLLYLSFVLDRFFDRKGEPCCRNTASSRKFEQFDVLGGRCSIFNHFSYLRRDRFVTLFAEPERARYVFCVLQLLIEPYRSSDFFHVWMPFGDSSNHLERTEGIITEAVIGSQLPAALLLRDLADAFQKSADRRAVGIEIEHILPLRQTLGCEDQDLLGEGTEINAGGKTDAIIGGQIGVRLFRYVDQSQGRIGGADSVQQLLCVAVMFGIINNCRFHDLYPDKPEVCQADSKPDMESSAAFKIPSRVSFPEKLTGGEDEEHVVRRTLLLYLFHGIICGLNRVIGAHLMKSCSCRFERFNHIESISVDILEPFQDMLRIDYPSLHW